MVAQYGGIRARETWRALCEHGPFPDVDAHTFGMLLRDLASHELIQQAGDGTIILGVAGERLVDHYTFYAAFSTPVEYRLIAGAETLGTLPATFPLTTDAHIIFGGRRWQIVAINESARTIDVEPASGGRAPRFIGSGGLVHDLVRRRMREVYLADEVPRYLDPTAHDMLNQGRDAFRRFALDERMAFQHNDKVLLFLWAGDRVLATVMLHLRSQGIAVDPDGLALAICGATDEGVMNALRTLVERPCDAVALARLVDAKETEKHHVFLGPELLARDYASSMLDIEGARRAVRSMLEQELGRKGSASRSQADG